jgi:Mor family transcriptional regulator
MDKDFLHQIAKLHPNEIPPPYDIIMQRHGFEAVSTIVEQLGGSTVYIPNMRTIFVRCLEEEARKEFNGHNTVAISKKYGFTDRHMRRMMGLA